MSFASSQFTKVNAPMLIPTDFPSVPASRYPAGSTVEAKDDVVRLFITLRAENCVWEMHKEPVIATTSINIDVPAGDLAKSMVFCISTFR